MKATQVLLGSRNTVVAEMEEVEAYSAAIVLRDGSHNKEFASVQLEVWEGKLRLLYWKASETYSGDEPVIVELADLNNLPKEIE